MIGPMIGSFAAYWGQAAPGLVAALLCLTNVIFAWFWLPESKQKGEGPPIGTRRTLLRAALGIIRHPGGTIPRFIWIYSIGMFAFAALTSVLSLYLGAEFGFTERSIGYVFLYVGLLSLLMRSVLLGPIVGRTGETWAMRLGALALVLGFAAYPLVDTLLLLAAVIPFVPIGAALLFPSTTALMSRASEKAAYGETLGIAQTYAGFARMVAPVLATFAFQRWGHDAPFWIASGCAAFLCALAFRVRPSVGD
jgi:predicted MFS family arabinose efflux permease